MREMMDRPIGSTVSWREETDSRHDSDCSDVV